MNTHETDFYTWTQQQAALLRAGKFAELDRAGLIEEIEDMGRSERRELENRLAVLLMHLLKWRYQPNRQGQSWRSTIKGQRIRVGRLLQQNPGLKPSLNAMLKDAYEMATIDAANETGLDESIFPAACPWTVEQALDETFRPESVLTGCDHDR